MIPFAVSRSKMDYFRYLGAGRGDIAPQMVKDNPQTIIFAPQ